jgi:hypothetical protein
MSNKQTGTKQPTRYYVPEVEGCVQTDGEIVRVRDYGGIPEFWTVYLRGEEGFAEAVSDCNSEESAQEIADILHAGLKAKGLLIG